MTSEEETNKVGSEYIHSDKMNNYNKDSSISQSDKNHQNNIFFPQPNESLHKIEEKQIDYDPLNYQSYYPNHIQIVGGHDFQRDYKRIFNNSYKKKIGSPESKSTNNSTKSKEENTAKNPIEANNHSTYFKDTEVKHNPSVSVINPIIENKIEENKQEPIDNALKMPIKKYKKAKSCKCLIV